MFIKNQPFELAYDREVFGKPIVKNHDFYAVNDNLWNVPYHSSPRNMKYMQQRRGSQPASWNQSFESANYQTNHRYACQQRLYARKQERQVLQKQCYNKDPLTDRSCNSMEPKKGRFKRPHDWNYVPNLSQKNIKTIYTPNILARDSEAIANVHQAKLANELDLQLKAEWRQNNRQSIRESLNARHNRIRQLEEKAGIKKVRVSNNCTPYGLSIPPLPLPPISSELFNKLAVPKEEYKPTKPFESYEYRGLVLADNPHVLDVHMNSKAALNSKTPNPQLSYAELDDLSREREKSRLADMSKSSIQSIQTFGIGPSDSIMQQDRTGAYIQSDDTIETGTDDIYNSAFTFGTDN